MSVDPRNAADTPFEVHDALQHSHSVDWQSDELNAQTGAPAHSSEDQESFEQQLNDLDLNDSCSVYPTSDSVSLEANHAVSTSSSAPNEVIRKLVAIQSHHCQRTHSGCRNTDRRHS